MSRSPRSLNIPLGLLVQASPHYSANSPTVQSLSKDDRFIPSPTKGNIPPIGASSSWLVWHSRSTRTTTTMLLDTSSIPGYTIYRDEDTGSFSNDAVAVAPGRPVHPLDSLSLEEIPIAAKLMRKHAHPKQLKFNCITLREPRKAEYAAFKERRGPRPDRRAFAIVLVRGAAETIEAVVNLTSGVVEQW
ncbi:copper amine oxidase, partial [Microdochium bolleyi]